MSAIKLTREEIVQLIDREAQRRRGISAGQLLRAYREGRLEDPGEVADLLTLADLLSEDDEIFEAA